MLAAIATVLLALGSQATPDQQAPASNLASRAKAVGKVIASQRRCFAESIRALNIEAPGLIDEKMRKDAIERLKSLRDARIEAMKAEHKDLLAGRDVPPSVVIEPRQSQPAWPLPGDYRHKCLVEHHRDSSMVMAYCEFPASDPYETRRGPERVRISIAGGRRPDATDPPRYGSMTITVQSSDPSVLQTYFSLDAVLRYDSAACTFPRLAPDSIENPPELSWKIETGPYGSSTYTYTWRSWVPLDCIAEASVSRDDVTLQVGEHRIYIVSDQLVAIQEMLSHINPARELSEQKP